MASFGRSSPARSEICGRYRATPHLLPPEMLVAASSVGIHGQPPTESRGDHSVIGRFLKTGLRYRNQRLSTVGTSIP